MVTSSLNNRRRVKLTYNLPTKQPQELHQFINYLQYVTEHEEDLTVVLESNYTF